MIKADAPKYGRAAIERYVNGSNKVGFGMSQRPEFYSGRGARTEDLGPKHLEAIYNGLVRDFGKRTGNAFCRMIDCLSDLSATNFLNQFYSFFDSGRTWRTPRTKKNKVRESGIDVGPDNGDGGREMIGMMSIFGLAGTPEEEKRKTDNIRSAFFRAVGFNSRKRRENNRMTPFGTLYCER